MADRYGCVEPAYLLKLGDGLYLDAQDSDHFSRYINHAEAANLEVRTSGDGLVDLFACRPVRIGDELCFDYGEEYWAAMDSDPTDDTRRYGRQRWLRQQCKLFAASAPAAGSLLLPIVVPLLVTLWST